MPSWLASCPHLRHGQSCEIQTTGQVYQPQFQTLASLLEDLHPLGKWQVPGHCNFGAVSSQKPRLVWGQIPQKATWELICGTAWSQNTEI
jgi:hypothetical protein